MDIETLRAKIKKHGQFPYGRRKKQYQSLPGMPGGRKMDYRFKLMKWPDDFRGKSILDIGCSIGAVCIEAKRRGAGRVVGIDNRKETIAVAKQYAAYYGLDITYYAFNIDKGLKKFRSLIGDDKFDYVTALSIYRHVKEAALADAISYYCQEACWFESHSKVCVADAMKTLGHMFPNYLGIKKLGIAEDRGQRANFKIIFGQSG